MVVEVVVVVVLWAVAAELPPSNVAAVFSSRFTGKQEFSHSDRSLKGGLLQNKNTALISFRLRICVRNAGEAGNQRAVKLLSSPDLDLDAGRSEH